MSEQSINSLNIPSVKNHKQINFQQNPTVAMQGTTMQGVPQSVGDTQLGNRVKNSSDMTQSPYTLPVAVGTWYGIAQAMDKFGRKCDGAYDESLIGKITGKADKLSDKITGSKLFTSSFGKWVGKKYTAVANYWDRVSSNPKNRLFYAIRNHKTNPECKLVKIPAAGLDGFLEADTKQVFEYFLKPADQAVQLKQYGVAKDVIEEVAKLPKAEKLVRLQLEELKYFGVKSADMVGKTTEELAKMLKELKITKGLGFDSVAHFEKVMSEEYALKHMDEIAKILRKGDPKIRISIWKKDGALGKVFSHLMGRDVGVSELANKFAVSSKTGAKTTLGKFFGKSFAYLTEGCTNRFAGGKLAVFMQAFIFADMFIHTFKAPKGEKGKTLIERFVNDFTYFLALPLGIWAMHKAGGLKYLGMTKEQVKAYRENLKHFNANHASYSKKMYKMRSKVLDRQLNAGVKNPFLKLIKKAANLLTVGIGRKKTYVSKSGANLNFLRKSKYWGKNALGYGIRFAIPMMLISPFIAKLTTKATHAVFGRPTYSVLDEDKDPEEIKAEDAKNMNNNAVASQQNTPASQTQTVSPVQSSGDTNLLNKYKNPEAPQQTAKAQAPQTVAMTKNPNDYQSDTNLLKQAVNKQQTLTGASAPESSAVNNDSNKEMEPVRTYIPSPVGMVQQGPDLSPLNSALAEADMAEKHVQDILAMK